ncbi:MAG: ribonuclease HII [Thermoleophilia bacterium]|nr:ribonuclease HII [Thermoleophilia bacterium]
MSESGRSPKGTGSRPRPRWDPFRFDRRRLVAAGAPEGVLAGADEAGRGCLAGPLVAAAVSLDYGRSRYRELAGLTDSKLLQRARREELYLLLLSEARRISIAVVSPRTIDDVGLHRSNLNALIAAIQGLDGTYALALVDGFDVRRPDLRAEQLVGGDAKSAAVAAASVVAKVTRDRLMRGLDALHPAYGFCEHVGYATRRHRQALLDHGPSVLHRRSFAGVDDAQLALWDRGQEGGAR